MEKCITLREVKRKTKSIMHGSTRRDIRKFLSIPMIDLMQYYPGRVDLNALKAFLNSLCREELDLLKSYALSMEKRYDNVTHYAMMMVLFVPFLTLFFSGNETIKPVKEILGLFVLVIVICSAVVSIVHPNQKARSTFYKDIIEGHVKQKEDEALSTTLNEAKKKSS
ncbi:hypothetical protein P4S95_09155 [Aneurinibacillus aneurinilyticus]|uniref:hypothetical protein n=1 Tax=Aneurinibacillus aneurinilyticus TaxID=1391 RepID=UPI002E1CA560|nr:hypothetical protein [Aneurinibacillus aneurinilyticus]